MKWVEVVSVLVLANTSTKVLDVRIEIQNVVSPSTIVMVSSCLFTGLAGRRRLAARLLTDLPFQSVRWLL